MLTWATTCVVFVPFAIVRVAENQGTVVAVVVFVTLVVVVIVVGNDGVVALELFVEVVVDVVVVVVVVVWTTIRPIWLPYVLWSIL